MIRSAVRNTIQNAEAFREVARSGNLRVMRSLAGPAVRGIVLQQGKHGSSTNMHANCDAHYTWNYVHDRPDLARLTAAARRGQWDPDEVLDWATPVDPQDPDRPLIKPGMSPLDEFEEFRRLPPATRRGQTHAMLSWMLSQFLHGEQGALHVACQVTQAVVWTDGKLYGSTQVVDEGRHVEVFDRYLQKIEKRYTVNDNLFVVLDSLMSDGRWDVKFLGMQILVEGLALGAFGTLRQSTTEPLLRELLRYVISDEARHVHFGVLALQDLYRDELGEAERREREDWAFEMCLLLRNRFLAIEFYEEFYAHAMSRRAWERRVLGTQYMRRFRHLMFRRIVPNLKRIHLLTDRVRGHYDRLGLLEWEHEKAAPELTTDDLIADGGSAG